MLHCEIMLGVCTVAGMLALTSLCRAEGTLAVATAQSVESEQIRASVDPSTGALVALKNKLTDEVYPISDDAFRFETQSGSIGSKETKLLSVDEKPDSWTARYRQGDTDLEAAYTLHGHSLEKRLAITLSQPMRLLKVDVSRPTFGVSDMTLTSYGYPRFERKVGQEACRTFFGRTNLGGLFTGIEMPYADVSLAYFQVQLAFAPHLKLRAGERFECELIYWGAYRRLPGESGESAEPLRLESEAVVAMTSAVLGPPRRVHSLASARSDRLDIGCATRGRGTVNWGPPGDLEPPVRPARSERRRICAGTKSSARGDSGVGLFAARPVQKIDREPREQRIRGLSAG